MKDVLMTSLKMVGSVIYGIIMFYLLWLFFYWITPFVMGLKWLGFIIYLLVAGGLLSTFVSSISTLLGFPMIFLCRGCKLAKFSLIISGLIFGYCSIRLPWGLDMEYGVLQWILGISLSVTIFMSFISLIRLPFYLEDDEECN